MVRTETQRLQTPVRCFSKAQWLWILNRCHSKTPLLTWRNDRMWNNCSQIYYLMPRTERNQWELADVWQGYMTLWHSYNTCICFFFFFFIYLLNAIKINLSCRTVSFHKVGLCDDTWCVIEKNTYNSYTDMRGKIIFSDFCWVSFTGRDTRAAILSYWHADLKTEGLSSLHGKFPVKKSCRCSL